MLRLMIAWTCCLGVLMLGMMMLLPENTLGWWGALAAAGWCSYITGALGNTLRILERWNEVDDG